MAKLLGLILLAVGAILSLVFLVIDFRISRRTEPYEGMNRVAPEIHIPLSLLSGAGSWMAWGWPVGLAVAVGQGLVFIFIATKLR